jgi:hypothetical protein
MKQSDKNNETLAETNYAAACNRNDGNRKWRQVSFSWHLADREQEQVFDENIVFHIIEEE